MNKLKNVIDNIVSLIETVKYFMHLSVSQRNQLFCNHMYEVKKDKHVIQCEKCGCKNRIHLNKYYE